MMDTAMIRLSSGKRINSAKDDAAGIQVAIRMEAEINGLAASLRNANDAQAAVDTAEGALGEVHTLIATDERDSSSRSERYQYSSR